MSDILIKNMKMPKSCCDCPLGFSINFGVICTATGTIVDDNHLLNDAGDEIRQSWCPLVEVPPHRRLIDADAIPYIFGSTHATEYDTVTKFVINRLPTIIEGDDGT